MPWAVYLQRLDPLDNKFLSTFLAALPVLVLFWLLVPRRWLAPKAAAAGAVVAILIAWLAFGMPLPSTLGAFVHGAAFGLMPVGWTIFNAMLLYNCTVITGKFGTVRRSVAELSGDARIQAILIAFAFGAFLEGAAGGGTPVAICGAILVGLGFRPFLAAVLCLIANTSPVAYGGLGTPLITLSGVTGIPTETLSIMAGHQLPLLSFIVPIYMVKCMCTWKQTWEVWPALVVAGGTFAVFQFTFATIHAYIPGLVLYPMTDIGGGIFSLIATAIFLRFWKPKRDWHFDKQEVDDAPPPTPSAEVLQQHAAEAGFLPADTAFAPDDSKPLTRSEVFIAWLPYLLMSALLMLSGLLRQAETKGPVYLGPIKTSYPVPIPYLHNETERDAKLHLVRAEQAALLPLASNGIADLATNVYLSDKLAPKPEAAVFQFSWITSPGTPVFVAAILSMFLLRMNRGQILSVLKTTCYQMRIPIPTIACMLGLSYVTRYAGMDATLGIAFAATGVLYPFFAAYLGWLGVFLTGTDAGSNALFGSLQKITATEVYKAGAFTHLDLNQAQVLICTANSTGGVMGKMIDAQSICVATAATHQIGREADIFKAVLWHSVLLAGSIGLITLLQAYIYPFTSLVP